VIGFAPKLTSTSDEASFLPTHYESIRAMQPQQQAFPRAATPAALIVLERADGGKLTDADSTKVNQIAQALTADQISHVTAIIATPASQNKLMQIIGVEMVQVTSASDKSQIDAVQDLRDKLPAQLQGTGLTGRTTGTAAQQLDSQSSGIRADAIIAIATVGLILVLRLLARARRRGRRAGAGRASHNRRSVAGAERPLSGRRCDCARFAAVRIGPTTARQNGMIGGQRVNMKGAEALRMLGRPVAVIVCWPGPKAS
jgi:uncharacterized membrane protein YdfJ with MMPL/SSD domain